MSLFAEQSFSTPATDDSSNIASSSSTPPTTIADSASLHSDISPHDVITVADDASSGIMTASISTVEPKDIPSPRRARRARVSTPVYNLSQLSGTSCHGKRRAKGDIVSDRRRRTIATDTIANSIEINSHDSPNSEEKESTTIKALALAISPTKRVSASSKAKKQTPVQTRTLRTSSRLSGVEPIPDTPSSLILNGKRNRKATQKALAKLPRELLRLKDTKEFSRIDDGPIVHTVWSNGKYVDPNEPTEQPARKKAKVEEVEDEKIKEKEQEEVEPVSEVKKRKVKKYLTKGLYAGQDYPEDITKGLSTAEKKQLAQIPELTPNSQVNTVMPLPIFAGFRTLLNGRDFKLPYHVCNPLPPGQPKPDEWKKMTKNRFIGESKDIWRKMPHINDYQSKCVCSPEDGCAESCQNRIMLYECDDTNCNAGKQYCTNRAFAELTARRAKGGKYRVGVEVIKTADRGYGVRSNRCFEPHQIIMEYAGEIITEEECERRMNEVYKDNECYYLMSFDQNMIIDATTGSIARFVNHSCNPNCRMIKWIVSGQPRMALFAGDKPIMTGDELTYDYNFDPFSAKNVQKCLCGSANCRGVLGPKPKELKAPKVDLKKAVKATVKAGKRKLKELMGDEKENVVNADNKRRKVVPAKPTKATNQAKRNLSMASAKIIKGAATKIASKKNNAKGAAKGAASVIKKTVSAVSRKKNAGVIAANSSKKTTGGSKSGVITLTKKTTAKRVIKTYGQASLTKKSTAPIVASNKKSTASTAKAPRKKVIFTKKATT